MLDSAAARDAAPPMWNVRMVSCVPGSPMDCAAITPIASPLLMMWPRAVTTVAVRTYTKVGVTRYNRTYFNRVDRVLFQQVTPLFVQQRVARNEDISSTRLQNVFSSYTTQYAIAQRSLTSPPSITGVIMIPSWVPQSSSVTTVSCATSTRRRVR